MGAKERKRQKLLSIAAKEESRGILLQDEFSTKLLTEGFMPRYLKKNKALIGLVGLGLVSRPTPLRKSSLGSGRFGTYNISNPLESLEIKDEESIQLAKKLLN